MAEEWKLDRSMVLSAAEANALLSSVQGRADDTSGRGRDTALLDVLIIEALLLSGLRNSEFCSLNVSDTIVETGVSAFVVRGQGGRGRNVYVPERVSELVWEYVHEVRPGFLPAGIDPGDREQPLVFNEHRRPFERTGLYRRVVKILTDAGLGERASVQLLRHTYGYLTYLATGGNLLFVQRQLGHAHPRITSVYARLVEESYAELAERVATVCEGAARGPGGRAYAPCRPAFDCETD